MTNMLCAMASALLLLGSATATSTTATLDIEQGGTVFKIEAWGANSLRVRASTNGCVAEAWRRRGVVRARVCLASWSQLNRERPFRLPRRRQVRGGGVRVLGAN